MPCPTFAIGSSIRRARLRSLEITAAMDRSSWFNRVDWIVSEFDRSIATIRLTAPRATIMPITMETIISISENPRTGP